MGRLTGLMPKGPLRLDVWSVHVLLGFALAFIVVSRIAWRTTRAQLPQPSSSGMRRYFASLAHGSLYVLLIAIVITGIANAIARGFPLFGEWRFPKLGMAPARDVVAELHDLGANVIAAAALLHAIAAIWHRIALDDGVFERMWLGCRGKSAKSDSTEEIAAE
jgi:cytochrome b561